MSKSIVSLPKFPLTPIGYSRGVPIYPIIGAEDVPEGQSASGSNTPDAGQSAGTDAPPASQGQSAQEDKVSREEFERLRTQLSAADQKRQEAENKARQLEDRDKSELEKTQTKAQELEQSVQQLQSELQQTRLENAFLRDSTFTWHDPSDVLRFVSDDDSVTIGEDGKVIGMEAALKKLAQNKPYLVKKEDANPLPEGPSGDTSNSGAGNSKKLDSEKLKTKYAALRR